jgi:DNA-binding Lrp family transcriptional regulator
MKDSNYIVVMGWMMTALGLNGNDLLAYALIYSHSQDGEGAYWGSLSHTADRLNISRRAAVDVLNRLVERGHIKKSTADIDGIQRCMYRAVVPDEATPPRKRKAEQSQPKKVARFTPPTVEEVQAYCAERGNKVDAQRFVDFYTANGWHQGRGKPIKDWRAAVRTWERDDNYNHNNNHNGQRTDKESVLRERRAAAVREAELLDAEFCAAKARRADAERLLGKT